MMQFFDNVYKKPSLLIFYVILLCSLLVALLIIPVIYVDNEVFILLICLAGTAIIVFLAVFPVIVSHSKLKAMPEQNVRAKVLEKGKFYSGRKGNPLHRYVTFELSDGSRKSFFIRSYDILTTIIEDDIGMLTYKERENDRPSISFDDRMFISFEKE